MPWSGSSYTKGNSATGGWTGDATAGVGIEAGRHDTQDNDFQNGINDCLNKNGLNSPTQNLPMGGYRHTGVGLGLARTDYAQLSQVQDSSVAWGATSGGTSTAYTISLTPAITAYAAGQVIRWIAHATVTGAATININGLGTKTLQRQGTALAGNEFKTSDIVEMVYDGTQFQVTSVVGAPLFIDRTNNRVGVGTTSPQNPLDVQGTQTVISNYRFENSASGGQLAFAKSRGATVGTNTIVQSGDQTGAIYFYGANGTGYDVSAGILAEIASTPGASNDMPGRLRFLTCIDGSASLSTKFLIENDGQSFFYTGRASDSTVHPLNIVKFDNVSTAGSNYFTQFLINNGATTSGRIASNGANAAAFFSTSDVNLKENIVDLPSQLSNILALRPVEFDFKDGSGHQIGFIAQEVEQVYPDNVYTDPDGVKFLGDMSRNDARVIKAIQDLNAKVEALEARVAELEG
jgi:hypothetical protein